VLFIPKVGRSVELLWNLNDAGLYAQAYADDIVLCNGTRERLRGANDR